MIDKNTWEKVKLGDAVRNVKDKVDINTCGLEYYLGGEHFDTDSLHVNGKGVIAESTIGPAFTMRFKPGQVMLVSRNPHLRKMAVADFEGICSNVTYVCETKSDDLLQEFLPFIMRSQDFWSFAEANKRGSTNFYLNWTDFAQYEFLLPPIEVQKRMAKLLWAADEAVQKNKSLLSALLAIKSVFMGELSDKLFSGDLQTELGEIMDYESGQVDPKVAPYRDMPLVAPNHVESGTGRIIFVETASEQNAISGKYKFTEGEIVYSKIRPNLNKVFIAPFNGLCSADMYPLKPKVERVSRDFLYYILISAPFLHYATTCSVRTSIPKLNRTDMSKFKLNCPPLDYQLEFVMRMKQIESAINKEEEHIRASLDVLDKVKEYFLGGAN